MTIANFKQQVANSMNRTLASLTSDNSQDMILAAMNDARRSAQRAHDFELLRTEDCYLSTHMGGVTWTTGCVTTPGGATPILMKRLDEVWNYGQQVIGGTTYYPRTTRVPYGYSGQFKRELPVVDRVLVTNQTQQAFTIQSQFAYSVGTQLFVTTTTTATPFKLVGIQWADDLTGSESPDIFLTYFTDWFRYATVAALNVYLKEDQQFPIRDGVMLRLWETVKSMDGTIANMGESTNLDERITDMSTPVTITPQQGIVKTGIALGQPNGSFQNLQNVRLRYPGGVLEQTPPWYAFTGWSAGSYYDGGVQTEPATSRPSMLVGVTGAANLSVQNTGFRCFGQYGARVSGVTMQVFKQTTQPTADTINTQCLVIINDQNALNLTLGNTLDIVIDGATTFKWRKNGGAYTTAVPITTTGVSIDSGSCTVWFQTATGFTVADTWSWTRSDWFYEATGTAQPYDWSYTVSGSDIFFCDLYGRLMVMHGSCVQSVGYRAIYGTHVDIYENHLVVGNYSTTPVINASGIVAWSDLNNLHAFFATDVNEADQYTLPVQVLPSDSVATVGVIGLWVVQNSLFVLTTTGIFRTVYYGLPVVFSFKIQQSIAATRKFVKPIASDQGIYFVSANGIHLFDGANVSTVSDALGGLRTYYTDATRNLTSLYNSLYFGGYDSLLKEAHFFLPALGLTNTAPFTTGGLLVYQERTKSWYFRSLAFFAGSSKVPLTTAHSLGNLIVSYPLGLAAEDTNYSAPSAAIADYSGTSYAVPTIETQDLTFDEVQTIHEINQMFWDVGYDAASGTFDPAGVVLEVSTRETVNAAVTWTTVTTWTTGLPGVISYRGSGRIFRFRITAPSSSATTKVTRNFTFNTLILSVLNLNKDLIRK